MTNDDQGSAFDWIASELLNDRIRVEETPAQPLRWSIDDEIIESLGAHFFNWNVGDIVRSAQASHVRLLQDDRTHIVRVDGEAGVAMYEAGLPIVIEKHATLAHLTSSIANILEVDSHFVTSEVVASNAGRMTPFHFDAAFTIAFQIAGRKKWLLGKTDILEKPITGWVMGDTSEEDSHSERGGPFSTEVNADCPIHIASQGDALFIPGGYWYATEAIERSLTLNIHVALPDWADTILPMVRRAICQKPIWKSTASQRPLKRELAHRLLMLQAEVAKLASFVLLGGGEQAEGDASSVMFRKNPSATIGIDDEASGACTVYVPTPSGIRSVELAVKPSLTVACNWLRDSSEEHVDAKGITEAVPEVTLEDATALLDALHRIGFVQQL